MAFLRRGESPAASRPSRSAQWGWAMYDWANSAFATTVMAAFFPVFFKQAWSAGADVNLSTARLGLANSLAGAALALLAPFLGALADQSGGRKRFLLTFALLGSAATAGLALVPQGDWPLAAATYALALVGFAGANIFYDALLPAVADPGEADRVSCLGYALGYLGGGLLLALNVAMTFRPDLFGLADAGAAVRTSFLMVAVWWALFSLPLARLVREGRRAEERRGLRLAAASWAQVRETLGRVRSLKPVWLFLLAYWFYIDGVDTVIRMAVDYGLSLGFAATDLILALLLVQFLGFPAALAFGRLGERWGARPAIVAGLLVYLAVTVWAAFIENRWEFYGLAAAIGLVQGGVQALSRSYFARLIPAERAGEFFGFYNLVGKFAAILGPALMGLSGLLARRLLAGLWPDLTAAALGRLASRGSILSVLVLFLAGLGLLRLVEREKRPPRRG